MNKISFTGSVAVGEGIMRDGAATMKRVTLELGGKSPTILLDDANFDQAIPAALGMAFMNSGQACAAGTRLLVPSKRLDAAKRAIVNAMRAVTVGDPADPKIAVGPMVSQKQYKRVQSYIRKGIEEGAEVLVGGEGRPQGLEAGYFCPALRAQLPCYWTCDGDRAKVARHLAPQAERGPASGLRGLLCARGRARGPRCGGLLPRRVYWSGVGCGAP